MSDTERILIGVVFAILAVGFAIVFRHILLGACGTDEEKGFGMRRYTLIEILIFVAVALLLFIGG